MTLTHLAWYKNFYRKFQTYVLVELGGHAVHYIYDRSLSWLDTRVSIEISKPMSKWNEAVIQGTIYMTAHYPVWYKSFNRKFQTYVLVDWGGHGVHYIYDSSLSWFDTRTSIESSNPMS